MTNKLVFGTKTMGGSSIFVVSVLARHSLGVGGSIRVHPWFSPCWSAQADRALGSALADPLEAEDPPLAGKILSYPCYPCNPWRV